MLRMISSWPMGVANGGGDWICALTVTAVVAIVIFLFASGGSVSRRRIR